MAHQEMRCVELLLMECAAERERREQAEQRFTQLFESRAVPEPAGTSASTDVFDVAAQLLASRKVVGIASYGVPLRTRNGKDFGKDADEELADWFVYWVGYRIEQQQQLAQLRAERDEALRARDLAQEACGGVIAAASNLGLYDGDDADSALTCMSVELDGFQKMMWRIEKILHCGSARPDDIEAAIEAVAKRVKKAEFELSAARFNETVVRGILNNANAELAAECERREQAERTPCGGAALIAAERRRQVQEEGWTPEHDDKEHTCGDLTQAAVSYAQNAVCQIQHSDYPSPISWPWKVAWWKPSADPIRNLVKAGALIAAEIDRLERSAKRDAGVERAGV